MSESDIKADFTVLFDGQFWVGYYTRHERGESQIARYVFGAEPSLAEIAQLVCSREWTRLRLLPAHTTNLGSEALAGNPKRRQREAAKASRGHGGATKSQEAYKEALAGPKAEAKSSRRVRRAEAAERQWQRRVEKHRDKHRGH